MVRLLEELDRECEISDAWPMEPGSNIDED
jgi:hypothetical protein